MQPVSLLLFEGDWILIQLAWWPLKPHSPCNAAKGVSVHVRSYMFVQLNHLFPGHLCASSNWSIAWRTWLWSNRTVPDFIHSAFWRVLLASPLLPLTISFTFSKAKPWQGTPAWQRMWMHLRPLRFLNSTHCSPLPRISARTTKLVSQACSAVCTSNLKGPIFFYSI